MTYSKKYQCDNLQATEAAALEIRAALTDWPACVFLHGELGAGKTTLCQFIIRSFGYRGSVTSPTYNLIQEYPVAEGVIYHMDLYRLQDPEELEFLAIGDLWSERSLFLVEWPEKGTVYLPKATHTMSLELPTAQQEVEDEGKRDIYFTSVSGNGVF